MAICIIVYGGYWLFRFVTYSSKLSEEEELWKQNSFKPTEIRGIVARINGSDEDCFRNLIVSNASKDIGFGICVCGKKSDFINFLSVGDSIEKAPGSFVVRIRKKSTNEIKEFYWPFCD